MKQRKEIYLGSKNGFKLLLTNKNQFVCLHLEHLAGQCHPVNLMTQSNEQLKGGNELYNITSHMSFYKTRRVW